MIIKGHNLRNVVYKALKQFDSDIHSVKIQETNSGYVIYYYNKPFKTNNIVIGSLKQEDNAIEKCTTIYWSNQQREELG